MICRSAKCIKSQTEEARFFASTNVVQKKQLSPLLVCTPSESVLGRYHELEREVNVKDEEHNEDCRQQALGNLYFDDAQKQVLDARL